ncbi:hypothetical protein Taro_010897 [Colocasia esculenta]|uniref:Uncharacterized protein n=1 Tax=Colocasia esculenta TaxID=4460 RepID=A0A843U4L9_COLES|nr:hypothetical protein [Colocasia esculenta]
MSPCRILGAKGIRPWPVILSPSLPLSPLFSSSNGAPPPPLPFMCFKRGGGPCAVSWRRGACVERGGGGQSDVKGPIGVRSSFKVGIA